ncbi:hypothetical protein JHL21_03435 [Devosia sp. WQ 349]|uniref:hypothetical protein n=1 Tax=Devosia sp. WQ 349K1 TaxID=2800329 RepID=UPI001903FE99|nr:hypothetical protein [Devosia sp. WQ 349K1]MBK1793544.1 hypothetical protein [Devosia sp. WQ 349K1]
MEVFNLRHFGAGNLVARFDVSVAPGVTLRDWQLRRTSNGLRVFPPKDDNGRGNVTLSSEIIANIRCAATGIVEGVAQHDHRHA